MKTAIWWFLAKILSLSFVRDWLLKRAKRTPYFHIMSDDGTDTYMERYWLINPYNENGKRKHNWFPYSARIHIIRREDLDRHLHDHPFNARTVVLRGWYTEELLVDPLQWADETTHEVMRLTGETRIIRYGDFHRISSVPRNGVMTLFITGPKIGPWGFLVEQAKVHHKKYLAERSAETIN